MSQGLQVDLCQTRPVPLSVKLQCAPGELLALVGPSGSGKSTVLRSIAGLHRCARALVRCGETVWEDTEQRRRLPTQRRRVGMVFQSYALFPHRTVLQNIMLAMLDRPPAERRRRALQWLERTNMAGLESRRPHELSGGQRQRVALARALAREPEVLLLDEPFSAVDQQTRRRLYRELARLRLDLPVPILLVTHDIAEVQQLADSLCLIHRGQTLQQGPVEQVMHRPDSKQSARLLGHQNLIPATVIDVDARQSTLQLHSGERLFGPPVTLSPGSAVVALIPPTTISLAGDSLASSNRLRGRVSDAVALGDEYSIRLKLDTVTKALRFRLPRHRVRELGIATNSVLHIDITASEIHLIDESRAAHSA